MTVQELFTKYTSLDDKILNEIKHLIGRLDDIAISLNDIKDDPPIVLYKKVENLKIEMVALLTSYKKIISRIECYREKGVFLEKFRKKILAENILRLVHEEKVVRTFAEVQVRSDERYLRQYREIEKVREILIIIWNTYHLHMDITIPTMTQIISTARKEIENEKTT